MTASPPPLAIFGSTRFGERDLAAMLDALPAAERAGAIATPEDMRRALTPELWRAAVFAQATAEGFDRDPVVAARARRSLEQTVVSLYLAARCEAPSEFPDERLARAYFAEHAAAFTLAPELDVAQIFFAAPIGGDPVRETIATGAAASAAAIARAAPDQFATLARERSEHRQSASRGGSLGWTAQAQLHPAIAAALSSTTPGDIAGPARTEDGFHVIKLLGRRGGAPPSFEDALPQVRERLRQAYARDARARWVQQTMAEFDPQLDEVSMAQLAERLRAAPAAQHQQA